jgi:glycosidase
MPTSINDPDVHAVFDQVRFPHIKNVTVTGENGAAETADIITPFPSPADWRDQWIYFLLVDRFNNPAAPPRSAPFDGLNGTFQGGTFNGVRDKLDYLRQLGVGALWLSPVLKNCQYNPFTYHGYGIQDFLNVDPRFASDPEAASANPQIAENELRALVDEAHALGMYVIFDIVLNHTGDVFEYVLDDGSRASEADWRDEPYTIHWRDENGHGRLDWSQPPVNPPSDAAVWPSELRRNDFFRRQGKGGEAGGDFASLKEMVTDFGPPDFPVRTVLIQAYQYLIAKYDVDGFRIDTLKFIEPDFAQVFGNAIREFALSIGKKNFFTFGEVYDNEEQIARFIGRQAAQDGDIVGVDAALDFPLFFKLPDVIKGQTAPGEVVGMFEHRKQVERGIVSSHGEASRYFVTFLDNHDQTHRFFFRDAQEPARFVDQLTLAAGCLFALQGIPSLYYGTEQGLHGLGSQDLAVREALWGKPDAFNRQHPFYRTIERLAALRQDQPALRYGRQYFRPLSGNGLQFGISSFHSGVLAFSRVLNDQEVLIVANTNTNAGWTGEVIVDRSLNPVGGKYNVLFTNKSAAHGGTAPGPVVEKPAGGVEIREVNDEITRGPARAIRVDLQEMEIQILRRGEED